MSCCNCITDNCVVIDHCVEFKQNGKECHSFCQENHFKKYIETIDTTHINEEMELNCPECDGKQVFTELLRSIENNDELYKYTLTKITKLYAEKHQPVIQEETPKQKFLLTISRTNCPHCHTKIDGIEVTDSVNGSIACPNCDSHICRGCLYYITKESADTMLSIGHCRSQYTVAGHERLVHHHINRCHAHPDGIFMDAERIHKIEQINILHKIKNFTQKLTSSEKTKLWDDAQEEIAKLKEKYGYGNEYFKQLFMENCEIPVVNQYEPPNYFYARDVQKENANKYTETLTKMNDYICIGNLILAVCVQNMEFFVPSIYLSSKGIFVELEKRLAIRLKDILPKDYFDLVAIFFRSCVSTGIFAYNAYKFGKICTTFAKKIFSSGLKTAFIESSFMTFVMANPISTAICSAAVVIGGSVYFVFRRKEKN